MSFFLRHFVGFLIQIGGGMLLSLLPFSGRVFRYPKKWVLGGYAALSVLLALGFPLVMGRSALRNVDWRSTMANLYMLFAILLLTALYFWILRTQTVKKLVALVPVLFYAATQYLLVNLASPLFPGGILPDVYPPLTLALYAGSALVLFPLTALLMARWVKPYLEEIEPGNIRREFRALLAETALYFLMLVLYASRPDGLLADYWWWIVPPMLLATGILGLSYWTLFRESVRRKRDSDRRKTLEIQTLQYEAISREMEQTRRTRHDMRHFLNRLADLLSQGEIEEAREYLTELNARTTARETVTYCGNQVVNGLLQYYVALAADGGVRCDISADCGEIPVSPVDLTILLGNTLENAIRACSQVEDPWISAQIGTVGGALALQVTNACPGVKRTGGYRAEGGFLPAAAFASTRPGGGYGLGNLEHIARKHGGDAQFRHDPSAKTFTTRIRLDVRRSDDKEKPGEEKP